MLSLPVLQALQEGNLHQAQKLLPGLKLSSPFLVSEACRRVWRRRYHQIAQDPTDAIWVTRVLVHTASGEIVGRAGFHGKPDAVTGAVEVGYEIDPVHRRKGHGRAALEIMLDVAQRDPRVKCVRASVSPGNVASKNLIMQYGFGKVGEQMDEEDGLEEVYETRQFDFSFH